MWQDLYQQKLVSVEEAAAKIESGDRIYMSPGIAAPYDLMEAITARYQELENVKVVSGQVTSFYTMFSSPEYKGHLDYRTPFMGPIERMAVPIGNVEVSSLSLSRTVEAVKRVYKCNVFIADVTPPDENGDMFLGPFGVSCASVGEMCDKVIFQVNRNQPKVYGKKDRVNIKDVTWVCECDHDFLSMPEPEVTPEDRSISNNILPYINDGDCIELGLGAIGNAVGMALSGKKNLSVHTELFNDGLMSLYKKGCLTDNILAAFAFGSKELYEFCEDHVKMAPYEDVLNPYIIAQHDNMVSINGCVVVDLTGQVGSESIGPVEYSGIGGALDFVRGATMSKGGRSFICTHSTYKQKGELRSAIVSAMQLGQIVSVPRDDVMYIVTEYGVADLCCQPIATRVERMIAIAHPDFRDQLRAEAVSYGLLQA